METSHTTQHHPGSDETPTDPTIMSPLVQHVHEATQREIDLHMERLLTIASHELRTPLTTINGNVQLALRRLSSTGQESEQTVESALEMLGRAKRQLDRLNNLIEQMLHAECIHAGRLDMQFEQCDLVAVIREAAAQHRLLWPNRTITLVPPDIEHSNMAVYVVADVDHIAQVIANYLNNALKFSPGNAPVVLYVERHGAQVRVGVRDQGPGLPPDEHERIWERFYRVPGIQELNGSGIGFGLGLYICREIAAQHGGQVDVESTQGKGSTFWFAINTAPEPIQTS